MIPEARPTGQGPRRRRGLRFALTLVLLAALPAAVRAQQGEADVFVARGILAYEDKRYEEALTELREALALAPDHPDALYYRGLTLMATGRLAEAATALEHARRVAPDKPAVLAQLGAVYFGLERYGDAEPLLETAFAADPGRANLAYYVGFVRYRKGEHERALQAFERETSPDPRIRQLARFYAGLSAASLGLRERAAGEFESAAGLLPASPLGSAAARLRHSTLTSRAREPEQRLRAEVRLGAFYDSNPAVVPEAADDPTTRELRAREGDSFGEVGSLRLDYSLIRTPRFDAILTYSLFGKYNNSQTDFNLVDHLGGITLASAGTAWDRPYVVQLQYTYDLVILGGEDFLRRQTVLPAFTLIENAGNLTTLQLQAQWKDYKEGASLPPEERRSGTNLALALTHVFRFDKDRHFLRLGYQADLEDTDGANYDYRGHRLFAGLQYTFPWRELRVRYDIDLHLRDYRHRNSIFPTTAPGTVRRSDRELTHTFSLTLPLPHNLALIAELLVTNNDSNLDVFSYDRRVFSLFMAWTY